MYQTDWKPHVTVATIVERKADDGKTEYLMVHEVSENNVVYNQPAGHLDEGEDLITAAIRETLEETAWHVEITAYLGIYHYVATNGITFLRHGFAAKPVFHEADRRLDHGIIEAPWMSYSKILEKTDDMRSTTVIQMLDNYRSGERYPLDALKIVNQA